MGKGALSETIKDNGDWKDGINIRDLGFFTRKIDHLIVQNCELAKPELG